jgi:hypothetical protein
MSGFLLIGMLVAIFILCYWMPDAEMKSGLRYGFLRFKGEPDNLRVETKKIGSQGNFMKKNLSPEEIYRLELEKQNATVKKQKSFLKQKP